MDPKLQDFDQPAGDETLAKTIVPGLDKLRARFANETVPTARSGGAWEEWRMLVERAVRIADRLEREVVQLRLKLVNCADAGLQSRLLLQVTTLEGAATRHKERWASFFKWTATIFGGIITAVLVAIIIKRYVS